MNTTQDLLATREAISHRTKTSLRRISVLFAICLAMSPSRTSADSEGAVYDFAVVRAYLKSNPYVIADRSGIDGETSYLFRVRKVIREEGTIRISGPALLTWREDSFRQRTYAIPDSGGVFTDELDGARHFWYYKPCRAAFRVQDLLGPTGGTGRTGSIFLNFPGPEIIQTATRERSEASGLESTLLEEYSTWWGDNASTGHPVLSDLLDSVLSLPTGGPKRAPTRYVDLDACPGEGCQYGKWHTLEPIALFDKPHGRKIWEFAAGDSFTAITGNVLLAPMPRIAIQPLEVYDSKGSLVLAPGRKYYVLTNIGEGNARIWVNGRIMEASDMPYNPTQEWWVKVGAKDGKKGWILHPGTGKIRGADYLE